MSASKRQSSIAVVLLLVFLQLISSLARPPCDYLLPGTCRYNKP